MISLTVELTDKDLEKLLEAFEAGKLDAICVVGITLEDGTRLERGRDALSNAQDAPLSADLPLDGRVVALNEIVDPGGLQGP